MHNACIVNSLKYTDGASFKTELENFLKIRICDLVYGQVIFTALQNHISSLIEHDICFNFFLILSVNKWL